MPARQLVRAAFLAAVTAALAYVRVAIPGWPVPFTGQTLGVMLAGALADPPVAFLSQAVYLLLGFAGLPVFAGGASGPGVIAGPTGGFLLGFPIGALVSATLRRSNRLGRLGRGLAGPWVAAVVGGVVVVHAAGLVHLCAVTHLPVSRALVAASLPFLPGDLLKAALAVAVQRRLRPTPGSHASL